MGDVSVGIHPPSDILGFSIFVRFLMSVLPGVSYSFCWLGTNDYGCLRFLSFKECADGVTE